MKVVVPGLSEDWRLVMEIHRWVETGMKKRSYGCCFCGCLIFVSLIRVVAGFVVMDDRFCGECPGRLSVRVAFF